MSSKPGAVVRLGLIGAGRWGKNFIRTIRGLDGVTLTALCSRNPDNHALVDSTCAILADWHDLPGSNLCDAVIIATPPETHAEILGTMIRARLPSMVEKPLTLDLQEALELQQLLRRIPTPVLVDHTYLFHPAYRELKRLGSQLGLIRSIQSEGGNHGPFRPNFNALWDYGPHDLSMCLDLLGAGPVRMKLTQADTVSQENGIGASYELALVFPNDVTATIHVSNIKREKVRRFAVEFAGDRLVFDDLAPHQLVNAAATPLLVSPELPLTRAVQTFAEGVRDESHEMFGLDLAVEIVRILHDAQPALPS